MSPTFTDDGTPIYHVPNRTMETLLRYIEQGVPTGSFVEAVLSNDLREACARADIENAARLVEIVSWLYNEAPGNCWGSPEKVAAWLAAHAERRKAERDKVPR